MTTLTTEPRAAAPADAPRVEPIPFGRLVRVELRKMYNTTSGFWLLTSTVLITIIAAAAVYLASNKTSLTFPGLLRTTSLPATILLPVMGVLGVTTEWSQRTALITFTQEPRRMRVIAAKLAASTVVGLLIAAITFGLASGLTLLARKSAGTEVPWVMPPAHLAAYALVVLMAMITGVAMGLAFMNTPAAIVTFFALPTLYPALGLMSWFTPIANWTDTSRNFEFLLLSDSATTEQWARFATSNALWILVPLLFGLWRLSRREIN